MRLDTSQQMRLQQKMVLAPRMIQSMEILQLPIMALQERIEQELEENPVLELQEVEPDEESEDGPWEDAARPDAPTEDERELVIKDDDNNELDFDRLETLSKDWDEFFNEEHRPSRAALSEESDHKHDAMQNMASRPQSLQDYLSDQIGFLDLSEVQEDLVRQMLAQLDDHGYLTTGLEEIISSIEPQPSWESAEAALRIVQSLDPPGVGARNAKECLLLQVTPETPHSALVRVLIENHLEDIQHNRLPVIQKRTGRDIPTIQEAVAAMKGLNPRPAAAFTGGSIPYVTPDIAVEVNEDGSLEIRSLDDYVPNIYISRRYVEMLKNKGADPQAREYVRRKIQSAQWLMDSIEQRRNTLEKVTRAIIEHQRAFLESGPEHVEPLKMQQVADQVGVHVTTVSRAVDDKWVQTPRGIFPLRRFFGGGTTTTDGEEVSWAAIKLKMREIIDNEDKSRPFSDEDLMNRLKDNGYPLARRTVTKYRKMLQIPSSRQRKQWGAGGK